MLRANGSSSPEVPKAVSHVDNTKSNAMRPYQPVCVVSHLNGRVTTLLHAQAGKRNEEAGGNGASRHSKKTSRNTTTLRLPEWQDPAGPQTA